MSWWRVAVLASVLLNGFVLVGLVAGGASAALARHRFASLIELILVGWGAVAVGGLGTFAGAWFLGGAFTTDPATLASGPWLVAGILATGAGECVIVVAAEVLARSALGRGPSSRWWLAAGALAGPALLGIGAGWGAFLAAEGYAPEQQEVAQALVREEGWVRVLAMLFVGGTAPVLEELCFRGWLLPALQRLFSGFRLGTPVALVATSLAFAGMHADAPWALPPLFLVGAVCGWLRLRSGSTFPGILAHLGNNGLALALVFAGAG